MVFSFLKGKKSTEQTVEQDFIPKGSGSQFTKLPVNPVPFDLNAPTSSMMSRMPASETRPPSETVHPPLFQSPETTPIDPLPSPGSPSETVHHTPRVPPSDSHNDDDDTFSLFDDSPAPPHGSLSPPPTVTEPEPPKPVPPPESTLNLFPEAGLSAEPDEATPYMQNTPPMNDVPLPEPLMMAPELPPRNAPQHAAHTMPSEALPESYVMDLSRMNTTIDEAPHPGYADEASFGSEIVPPSPTSSENPDVPSFYPAEMDNKDESPSESVEEEAFYVAPPVISESHTLAGNAQEVGADASSPSTPAQEEMVVDISTGAVNPFSRLATFREVSVPAEPTPIPDDEDSTPDTTDWDAADSGAAVQPTVLLEDPTNDDPSHIEDLSVAHDDTLIPVDEWENTSPSSASSQDEPSLLDDDFWGVSSSSSEPFHAGNEADDVWGNSPSPKASSSEEMGAFDSNAPSTFSPQGKPTEEAVGNNSDKTDSSEMDTESIDSLENGAVDLTDAKGVDEALDAFDDHERVPTLDLTPQTSELTKLPTELPAVAAASDVSPTHHTNPYRDKAEDWLNDGSVNAPLMSTDVVGLYPDGADTRSSLVVLPSPSQNDNAPTQNTDDFETLDAHDMIQLQESVTKTASQHGETHAWDWGDDIKAIDDWELELVPLNEPNEAETSTSLENTEIQDLPDDMPDMPPSDLGFHDENMEDMFAGDGADPMADWSEEVETTPLSEPLLPPTLSPEINPETLSDVGDDHMPSPWDGDWDNTWPEPETLSVPVAESVLSDNRPAPHSAEEQTRETDEIEALISAKDLELAYANQEAAVSAPIEPLDLDWEPHEDKPLAIDDYHSPIGETLPDFEDQPVLHGRQTIAQVEIEPGFTITLVGSGEAGNPLQLVASSIRPDTGYKEQTLLKGFDENPLADVESPLVQKGLQISKEAALKSKVIYRAQLGHWKGVFSRDKTGSVEFRDEIVSPARRRTFQPKNSP